MFGTAYTLPEKRMLIGVFAPLSYGVNDRITLSTHPILDLLLAPNAGLRIKLYDGPITFSAAAAYAQSFYVDHDNPAEGQARVFGIASFATQKHLVISVTGGLAQELTENNQSTEGSLTLHYRVDARNLMMLQYALTQNLQGDTEVHARGVVFYAYAFPAFKAGAGVLAGRLPQSLGSIPLNDENSRIVPYADIWWSF